MIDLIGGLSAQQTGLNLKCWVCEACYKVGGPKFKTVVLPNNLVLVNFITVSWY